MNILIAGLGFLGEPLAKRLRAAGHAVTSLTQSPDSRRRLGEAKDALDARQADVTRTDSLRTALTPEEWKGLDWIIHCVSSGRGGLEVYRQVYLDGLRNLRHHGSSARLLFTSSSSVYAQTEGEWVDESSPAQPTRETGAILRETEDFALQSGGLVARLAGIYGPGRSYILLKYLSGTAAIEGDGGRFLNQVHVADIVEGLHHLITSGASGPYNIVDSTPQRQRDLYAWLAAHFNGSLPPQAPPDYQRKRGWTHKRVSNRRLRASGWTPRYPSFQDAVLHDPELVPSIRALANDSQDSRSEP